MNSKYTSIGFRLLFMACIALLQSCNTKQPADFIIHHAVIYTCDSAFSVQEAMAVKEGRILATGSNTEILARYTSDSMVNALGQYISRLH